ncbi:DinB family protein [Pedobacter sp. V48]|uniref:DinB family protein n=1 Tax=Pedobacter sp. V48 TaxID=509635 RepID=UPI00190F8E5A|nr:DinB family protein [Pedobacter sp. V48]
MTMINTATETVSAPLFINSNALLDHWQGHRRLTRRVIEAFPEDKLFNYSVGGMRPLAGLISEITSMSGPGIKGIATDEWTTINEMDHHTGKTEVNSKEALLKEWDRITDEINTYWAQIPEEKFQEVVLAFGQYEGEAYGIILYFIDNEIHHRAQATVYLRSLGIEPPAFWNRD